MSARYEDIRPPRFISETNGTDERFVIPAERNFFVMAFLTVWLCGWTVGGFTAISTLFTKGFQPFLFFWSCGWLLGELFAATALCWFLTGSETLTLIGSDLQVGYRLLGFTRRRLYRGSEVRNLTTSEKPIFTRHNQMNLPFLTNSKYGAIKFSYGARTIYLGSGLDETEGRMIVEAIQRRLPKSRDVGQLPSV